MRLPRAAAIVRPWAVLPLPMEGIRFRLGRRTGIDCQNLAAEASGSREVGQPRLAAAQSISLADPQTTIELGHLKLALEATRVPLPARGNVRSLLERSEERRVGKECRGRCARY